MKLYWTTKGRVVYDRKKHPFTIRDVVRIGKTIGAQIFKITPQAAGSLYRDVEVLLQTSEQSEIVLQDTILFGGGGFGGAGATREFDSARYKMMIIIEETL